MLRPPIGLPLAPVCAALLALCGAAHAAQPPAAGAAPADAAAPRDSAAAAPDKTRKVHKSTPRRQPRKPPPAASAKAKAPAHDPQAARFVDVSGLGEVTVYAPQAPARGLALFASGDGGWNLGVWDMAHTAAQLGYWVAGFSTAGFLKALENGDAGCSDAAGLLARLGDRLKRELDLPAGWAPVLIGYSSGATVMYAALVQAGDARFSGAMTLGFCPDLIVHKPFCAGAGLSAEKQTKPPYGIVFDTVPKVAAPWIVLQGEIDQVCNPPATAAFVRQVQGGRIVMLPKVGHGYGVPRNWMPQYRQGLIDLRDGAAAPVAPR